eukprot:2548492-Karenia_brevis.AAC.1
MNEASSASGKRNSSPDIFPAKQAAWIQAGVGQALEAFAGAVEQRMKHTDEAVHKPVSYTHLTLPTICSV